MNATLTGFLRAINAVGGETTGWALRPDAPASAPDGRDLREVDVDPRGRDLRPLAGDHVKVSGPLRWVEGIERSYWLIEADSIVRAPA